MKKLVLTATMACAVSLGAAPKVTTVALSQTGGRTYINYTLERPAIVTLDIQTNTLANAAGDWVSIGAENFHSLSGDVNKVVREVGSERTIVWKARSDWPDHKIANGLRAEITAWATNHPPEFLVVNLTRQNDVTFYATASAIPYGLDSDYYRSSAMILRKIPAANKIGLMGTSTNEDATATSETLHAISFTQDYYLGIYELTQAQVSNVTGNAYSTFKSAADSPFRPCDALMLLDVRGAKFAAVGDTIAPANPEQWWPRSGYTNITTGCIISKFRQWTGLSGIDLPTEAQWEFACRAGSLTGYQDGKTSSSANDFAWTTSNAGGKTHKVGLLKPNEFGLYDMHGNVWEMCLDRVALGSDYWTLLPTNDLAAAVTMDQIGALDNTQALHGNGHTLVSHQRVAHGGSWSNYLTDCRAGKRESTSCNWVPSSDSYYGARFFHPAIFH